MSSFIRAWPVIKDHEGSRFTNHLWDPGAATKFGITLRTAQAYEGVDFDVDDDGDIDVDDIRLLDETKAYEFYEHWWNKFKYYLIVDQMVATKVMDVSINMGPRGRTKSGRIIGAHVLVQRAVIACGYDLLLDGRLGPKSVEAINECTPRELLFEICTLQEEHYERWLSGYTKIPGDREVARDGLKKRAAWPFIKNAYIA